MSNDDEKPDSDQPPEAPPEKKSKRPKYRTPRSVPRPPEICKIIDKVFATPSVITEQGEARHGTVFEAITLMLERETAKGRPGAQKALRKYEAYAAARPKVHVSMSEEEALEAYKEFIVTGTFPGQKPRKLSKAEIERAKEMQNLTPDEAAEVYQRTLKEMRRG